MDLGLLCAVYQRKRRDPRRVPEAGELLQRSLRLGGQPPELYDHEVHHVVGVPFGVNTVEVPRPAATRVVKSEEALVFERGDELDREKWITPSLVVNQLCEWQN